MLLDVIEVKATGDYRLRLKFEDGVEGEIDFREIAPFRGIFAPLKNPAYFAQVRVHPELGVICWPNEADIDTMVLYAKVTNRPEILKPRRVRYAEA